MSKKITNIIWEDKSNPNAFNLAIDEELIVLAQGDQVIKASSTSQLSKEASEKLKQNPENFAKLVFASKN